MTERDALLTAVQKRVERAQSGGDAAPLLEPAAAAEASTLAAEIRGTRDPDAWHALGMLHWLRSRALPEGEDQGDLADAVSMFLPFILSDFGQVALPRPLLPQLIDRAHEIAGSALTALSESYDPDQIDGVVAAWRRIVFLTPESDRTGKAAALLNLGATLRVRHMAGGALTDLDSAITATEAGIAAAPEDFPAAKTMRANLGVMLQDRYLRAGSAADLHTAIEHFRAGAAAAEPSPERQMAFLNLGNALRLRYDRDGQIADLAEAITVTEQAIAFDPEDPAARGNLGLMLTVRFQRLGNRADIDHAVEALRAAVDRTPADHPNRCARLSGLAAALGVRHETVGTSGDADEAIDLARAALDAAPRDYRGLYLGNLGGALVRRFHDTHQAADLDEAIATTRASAPPSCASSPWPWRTNTPRKKNSMT
jgi:tetratricopeptide (TPR) repeat protein